MAYHFYIFHFFYAVAKDFYPKRLPFKLYNLSAHCKKNPVKTKKHKIKMFPANLHVFPIYLVNIPVNFTVILPFLTVFSKKKR